MRETIVSRRLQRIIAAAMAVVVCAIVGSVAVVQWQHRQSEILGAGENVQNLARVIEGQVRGNMDAIDITLNGLARALPRLPGTQRPGDADIHTLLSDSLKHLPFARALWVLNAADHGAPQSRTRLFVIAGPRPVTPPAAEPRRTMRDAMLPKMKP